MVYNDGSRSATVHNRCATVKAFKSRLSNQSYDCTEPGKKMLT
jgi:hypothetical protein